MFWTGCGQFDTIRGKQYLVLIIWRPAVAKRLGTAGVRFAPLEQGNTPKAGAAAPYRHGKSGPGVKSANATSASLMLDWPGYEVRSGFAE
jgi:hypothetical protein